MERRGSVPALARLHASSASDLQVAWPHFQQGYGTTGVHDASPGPGTHSQHTAHAGSIVPGPPVDRGQGTEQKPNTDHLWE
jgi:hypothetical protein